MKLTHKLCGAALVAVVGIAVAGPGVSITKAAEDTTDGPGKIVFTDEDYTTNTDGGKIPDTTETDPTLPSKNGEFVIRSVSPLDFGTAEATVGKTVVAFAAPHQSTGNAAAASANFVRFKDNRKNDDNRYQVTANLTTQFTSTAGKELTGATIEYTNLRLLDAAENGALKPAESGLAASVALAYNTEAPVYTNADATKGRGDYFVAFGQLGDAVAPADESVKLTIPSDTALYNGEYNAAITWTISDVPMTGSW
ncbi:WxL domain-containing protein [Candidatus Enterococcus clewellii]|uniref:WxL domain-containing protein n=1 Tax=Candidatus Enterococcus clewellii TaxID=1834193 RepID=A0A242K8J3_9ENTE|nr:WxL domain-containing protein [Enterococcus sp. 9E7_DIV0242]OTP17472.1 hypothetical protein A5888_001610 [Enterococcus sp. 9E7_DIV0242]